MDNIFKLNKGLMDYTYKHANYQEFNICDPKPRNIHKSVVRDRLLHHAIYKILYPFFDKFFITDSFSCRVNKGIHKAILRFQKFGRQVSENDTKTCRILKCDIRKFFDSVDHEILLKLLKGKIDDKEIVWLLEEIIQSFDRSYRQLGLFDLQFANREREVPCGHGIPIGNLTSQLFANIYLHELDKFIKHKMKVKYYIRYADDFVIFSKDKKYLVDLVPKIDKFLHKELKLRIHPKKLFIKTLSSGIDFLGWVHFPKHRVIRTTTKRRVFKRIFNSPTNETKQSYLGLLKYGETFEIVAELEKIFLLSQKQKPPRT